VALHLLAVVADEVGGLGDVAHRLEPVLAHLEADERGKVEAALLDQLGRAAQERRPLRPVPLAPRGKATPGRSHGVVHVLRGAHGKAAEQSAPIDGAVVLERVPLRFAEAVLLAVDEVPVPAAERRPQPVEGDVPAALELVALAAGKSRVGDPLGSLAHAGYSRANPLPIRRASRVPNNLLRRQRPARGAVPFFRPERPARAAERLLGRPAQDPVRRGTLDEALRGAERAAFE
jgi:hypothetical protein